MMSVKQHNYDRVNMSVFCRFLKVRVDVDDVAVGDKLFPRLTAAT